MSATAHIDWIPACNEAMEEMLETMFFESLLDAPVPETAIPEDALTVLVSFQGAVSGRVWVALTPALADHLLVNFLGREDSDPTTLAEQVMVTCELANMLCGCMLSRVDPENRLEIAAPHIVETPALEQGCMSYPLESGHIYVALEA